jgi:hypothetical protein
MNIERTAQLVKATNTNYVILAKEAGLSLSRINNIGNGYNNDMAVDKLKALAAVVAKRLKRSHKQVFLEMAGF